MNIYLERTKNLAPDRTKKREFVVTRERKLNNKYVVTNVSFDSKSDAQKEIIKAFAEIGAYV